MKKSLVFVLFLILLLPGCLEENESKKIEASLLREDVEFLVKSIEEIHPDPYTRISKEAFYKEKDRILEEIEDMDVYEFYNKIAPLVAMIGDAHTSVYPLSAPEKSFPVPVAVLDEGIFVARDHENITGGSEILSIDGVDSKELTEEMLSYVSYERREYGLARVESGFPLYLYSVLGAQKEFTVEYRSGNRTEERTVEASSPTPYVYPFQPYWRGLQSEVSIPPTKLYPYLFVPMGNKTALLIINSFGEGGSMPWEAFLSGTFSYLKEHGIENLIIDIRANGGGASSMGDRLIDYLTDKPWTQFGNCTVKYSEQAMTQGGYKKEKPGTIVSYAGSLDEPSENPLRFSGSVYLLTSRFTFSSASSFAAAIKDFGIGTLMGEETGGIFPNFGDVISFQLPNSKIDCGCSYKKFHRWRDTDPGRGITPDYEVKPLPEDLAAGRDRALDFALDLAAGL